VELVVFHTKGAVQLQVVLLTVPLASAMMLQLRLQALLVVFQLKPELQAQDVTRL
jgi:hypothetical protein